MEARNPAFAQRKRLGELPERKSCLVNVSVRRLLETPEVETAEPEVPIPVALLVKPELSVRRMAVVVQPDAGRVSHESRLDEVPLH